MLITFIVLLILFLYALFEYRNIQRIQMSVEDFGVSKKLGIKIVFISDIQYDFGNRLFFHRLMRKLVKMINEEHADLVLFGGDFIHHHATFYPVFNYLKDVKGDKVAVLGNHDYKDRHAVENGCHEAGIHLLVNESIFLQGYTIIGLDDLREGDPKMPDISNDDHTILLLHEPDDFENYFEDYDFSMAFAGHLHAGQVSLFGMYAPIVPSLYQNRYLHGLINRRSKKIYVTSGLGGFVFFLPLRFFAKPEIVVIDA